MFVELSEQQLVLYHMFLQSDSAKSIIEYL